MTDLINKIIFARYGRKAEVALDEYGKNNEFSTEFAQKLIEKLEEKVSSTFEYPGYKIPEEIELNRRQLLSALSKELEELNSLNSPEEIKSKLYKLFVVKNELVKYCTRQWLLINPGLALEFTEVKEDLPQDFLSWLSKSFGVSPGDKVVQRHVVSNNERGRLKESGIPTPYDHWDSHYYEDAMSLIQKIVASNPECKGIISDGSWVYNPSLYELADDGKPYASFTFLKDERLTGKRFFYMAASPTNEQSNQYNFAIRSERRKKYIEENALKVDVYFVFYPRAELTLTYIS